MLAIVVAVAVLNHFMLVGLWGCRRDGKSAMCCPFVGCGVFVLASVSLVLLARNVEPDSIRTFALLVGFFVFFHFAVQIGLMTREEKRRPDE